MARLNDRDDWFELWYADRESILFAMIRNLAADLSAGYDYFGSSARKQRADIEEYRKETDETIDKFKAMDEKEVNRWCFYEMKKKGAIA